MLRKINLVISIKDLREILNYNFEDLDNRKIEKIEGQGLSTNDFSDFYKNKLDNIEAKAQVNKIESISLDGSTLPIDGKKNVNIHQPKYSIIEKEVISDKNFKEYNLTIDGEATGVAIEVPKDIFLKDGSVQKVTTPDAPYSGAKLNDIYLQLNLNDNTPIYIPLTSLQYSAGQDITIENNVIATSVPIPRKISELENDNFTVTDENYVHTDNNFSNEYIEKITNLEANIGESYNNLEEKIQQVDNKVDSNKTETDAAISEINNNIDSLKEITNNKVNKATTLAGYGIEDAYTKSEIDSKISSIFRYQGSVPTYDDLPTEGVSVGDVYNTADDDANYVWNGTDWDKLSETFDLTPYLKKEEAAATYATKVALDTKVDKEEGKSLIPDSEIARLATLKNYDDTDIRQTLDQKQNKLTAGTGITIENDVISSTQTEVAWGNITGDINSQTDLKTSLDQKQNKLIAGTGIEIEGDTISSVQSGVAWGNITGDINSQTDLKTSLDTKGSQLSYENSTLELKNADGTSLSKVEIKSAPDVDGKTVTFNDNSELQTVGIRTVNNVYKTEWIGTSDELLLAQEDGLITPETECKIIDDEEQITAIIPNATSTNTGLVKPDGTTTIVDEDGTIHAITSGETGALDYNAASNKPQINGITLAGNKTASDLSLASYTDLLRKNPKLVTGDNISITDNEDGTQTISANLPSNVLLSDKSNQKVTGLINFNSEKVGNSFATSLQIGRGNIIEDSNNLYVGYSSSALTPENVETIVTSKNAPSTIPYAKVSSGGIIKPDNRTLKVDDSGVASVLSNYEKQDTFRVDPPLKMDKKTTKPVQGLTVSEDNYYPTDSYRFYYYDANYVYSETQGTLTYGNMVRYNIPLEESVVYELTGDFTDWWLGELETNSLQFLPRLAMGPSLNGVSCLLIPDSCKKSSEDSTGKTLYFMYGSLGSVAGLHVDIQEYSGEVNGKTYIQMKIKNSIKHLYIFGHNTDSTKNYVLDVYADVGTNAREIMDIIDTIGMNINFGGVGADYAKTGWNSLVKSYYVKESLLDITNFNEYSFGNDIFSTPEPKVRSVLKVLVDFNNLVDKTTEQVIRGIKTFAANLIMSGANLLLAGNSSILFPSAAGSSDGISRLALNVSGNKGVIQGNSLELSTNNLKEGGINFRIEGRGSSNLTVESSEGKASILNMNSIKAGENVSLISNPDNGTITINSVQVQYTLPQASDTVLGGIKVGENLSIDENGVLSASGIDELLPDYVLVNNKKNQVIDGSKSSIQLKSLNASDNKLYYPLSFEEPVNQEFLNLGFDYNQNLILTRENGVDEPEPAYILITDFNVNNYLPKAATVDKLGLIKPDGKTLKISEDGTLSSLGEGQNDYNPLDNKPQINGITLEGNKQPDELGLATIEALGQKQNKLTNGKYVSISPEGVIDTNDDVLYKNKENQVVAGQNSSLIFTTSADASGQNVKFPMAFSEGDKSYYFGIYDNDFIVTTENNVTNPTIDRLILTSKNIDKYLPVASTTTKGLVRPDGTTITVDLDGTIHGVDVSGKQDKLTAGSGIEIKDNVISNTEFSYSISEEKYYLKHNLSGLLFQRGKHTFTKSEDGSETVSQVIFPEEYKTENITVTFNSKNMRLGNVTTTGFEVICPAEAEPEDISWISFGV